jgi:hypothetical protein
MIAGFWHISDVGFSVNVCFAPELTFLKCRF